MLWIILLVVLVVAFLLHKWLSAPPLHKATFAQMPQHFRTFFGHSVAGSILGLELDKSGSFLQFAKRESANRPFLEFAFPDAPWSRDRFESMVAGLRRAGFECEIQTTDSPITVRFCVVAPITAMSQTMKILGVAAEVFGWSPATVFMVRYKGKLLSKTLGEIGE